MNKKNIIIIRIIILLVFISIWEFFGRTGLINTFLFSYPSQIIEITKLYLVNGSLYTHIFVTLMETIIGLLLGTSIGILFGIVLWWCKTLADILDPYLVVLNALPKTALAPIIIIWVGTGAKGIIAVSISLSIIVSIITSYQYFMNVDKEQILMLKSFKANKLKILMKLILPSNFYNLLSLFKINIGLSFVGVIVGEFIVSKEGIGYLIMYGSQVFKMQIVMMGVLILALSSFVLYEIVNIFIYLKYKRKDKN